MNDGGDCRTALSTPGLLIITCNLQNYYVYPVSLGKYHIFLVFSYLCPNKFFLYHKYAKKGFYEKFAL